MTELTATLDASFLRLHARSVKLVGVIPLDRLFWHPASEGSLVADSCGEQILRCAAVVEQSFGGITVNLWDDPLEWTLPETLSTPQRVTEYLNEVEATRLRGFTHVRSDLELFETIAVPSGEQQTLLALIVDTLARASHHQGRAFATYRLFASQVVPFA